MLANATAPVLTPTEPGYQALLASSTPTSPSELRAGDRCVLDLDMNGGPVRTVVRVDTPPDAGSRRYQFVVTQLLRDERARTPMHLMFSPVGRRFSQQLSEQPVLKLPSKPNRLPSTQTTPIIESRPVVKLGGGVLSHGSDPNLSFPEIRDLERVVGVLSDIRPSAVVASALYGVTNRLIDIHERSRLRQDVSYQLDSLERAHLSLLPSEHSLARAEIEKTFRLMRIRVSAIQRAEDPSLMADVHYNWFVSRGEFLSAQILGGLMGSYLVVPSEHANGIRATAPGRQVTGDLDRTLLPDPTEMGRSGLILTGFYGIAPDGSIALFGRSGTDHSASHAAACLGRPLLMFKNSLLHSANPYLVRSAQPIDGMDFAGAELLASLGESAFHPNTIGPLRERNQPMEIRSIFEPKTPGAVLSADSDQSYATVISRKGLVMMELNLGRFPVDFPADSDGPYHQLIGQLVKQLELEGVFILPTSSQVVRPEFLVEPKNIRKIEQAIDSVFGAGGIYATPLFHQLDCSFVALVTSEDRNIAEEELHYDLHRKLAERRVGVAWSERHLTHRSLLAIVNSSDHQKTLEAFADLAHN